MGETKWQPKSKQRNIGWWSRYSTDGDLYEIECGWGHRSTFHVKRDNFKRLLELFYSNHGAHTKNNKP